MLFNFYVYLLYFPQYANCVTYPGTFLGLKVEKLKTTMCITSYSATRKKGERSLGWKPWRNRGLRCFRVSKFKVRKASAWIACNKMTLVWTSMLPRATKIKLFGATVESVLLYGRETWTVIKKLEKRVNGCYTRMLWMALNMHWQQHMNNQELYGSLPTVRESLRARGLRLAGHVTMRRLLQKWCFGSPTWSPKSR